MYLGVEDLVVIGIFVFPGIVAIENSGVVSLEFLVKFPLGFPLKLYFEILMDPYSLYYALIHLDLNRSFNQDSYLALTK